MEALGKAYFKVVYNNKDISSDISPYLISIKYTDNTEQKVDEVQLELENVDAFWENEWYPEKGAKLTLDIGREAMLPCGDFEVDEIQINSFADVVTIKAVSAGITTSTRSKKSKAYEEQSLKQIVQDVASANGFTVEGTIKDITFKRITQNRESDITFLRRLSEKFGYYFSIRGTKLVFTEMYELVSGKSVRSIDRTDCMSYSITDKSAKVFRKANVSSYNPVKKEVVTYNVSPTGAVNADGISYQTIPMPSGPSTAPIFPTSSGTPSGDETFSDEGFSMDETETGDELNINGEYVEDESQAQAVGSAALLRENSNQQEGSLTVAGDETLVAGNNFQFTGIGKLSGKYHITASEHSIAKEGGYEVTLQFKRVGFIELTKGTRKKAKKSTNYKVKVIQ